MDKPRPDTIEFWEAELENQRHNYNADPGYIEHCQRAVEQIRHEQEIVTLRQENARLRAQVQVQAHLLSQLVTPARNLMSAVGDFHSYGPVDRSAFEWEVAGIRVRECRNKLESALRKTDAALAADVGHPEDAEVGPKPVPLADIVATIRGEPVGWTDQDGKEHVSYPIPADTVTLPAAEVRRLVLAVEAWQAWWTAPQQVGYLWTDREAYSKALEERWQAMMMAMADALVACQQAVQAASEGEDDAKVS